MAWARLDDQFAFNPKIVSAGNLAAGIFARALCWSSAHGTDGFIPENIAMLLCDPGPGATRTKRERDAHKIRAKLAEEAQNTVTSASLWVPVAPGDEITITGRKDSGRRPLPDVHIVIEAHGYYIRDFLHYNRARTDARTGESADEIAPASAKVAHKDVLSTRPVPTPKRDTSNEASLLPTPLRPRDEIWDALEAELGPVATKSERGKRNQAVKQLRDIAATADDVHAKCRAYRLRWPTVEITDQALVKHWSTVELALPQGRPLSAGDLYAIAEQMRDTKEIGA